MKFEKVKVIAEAGVNHNGSLKTALKMIESAANAGSDFIKFKSFNSINLVSKNVSLANYQKINLSNSGLSQLEMLKKLEINSDWYPKLISHCSRNKIGFLSSAFDDESLDILSKLDLPFIKIPSGEITNLPILIKSAKLNKPVILSTGMSSLNEIKEALEILIKNGLNKSQIMVLHCNSEYPTPYEDVNLHAMNYLKRELNVNVGYSDHTIGNEASIAAVALGAKVIEKHFTLNKDFDGPDHKASLEPEELKSMISSIRVVEKVIYGSGIKEVTTSERKNIIYSRKSIHLKKDLVSGSKISEDDLIMKRPGDGISPMKLPLIINKILKKDIHKGDKLFWKDLINRE